LRCFYPAVNAEKPGLQTFKKRAGATNPVNPQLATKLAQFSSATKMSAPG
jgi:hypothetical protein